MLILLIASKQLVNEEWIVGMEGWGKIVITYLLFISSGLRYYNANQKTLVF